MVETKWYGEIGGRRGCALLRPKLGAWIAGHGKVESDDGRPSRRQRSRLTELSRVVSDSQIILQSPIHLITKCQLEEDRGQLEVKNRRCSENSGNFTPDC